MPNLAPSCPQLWFTFISGMPGVGQVLATGGGGGGERQAQQPPFPREQVLPKRSPPPHAAAPLHPTPLPAQAMITDAAKLQPVKPPHPHPHPQPHRAGHLTNSSTCLLYTMLAPCSSISVVNAHAANLFLCCKRPGRLTHAPAGCSGRTHARSHLLIQ